MMGLGMMIRWHRLSEVALLFAVAWVTVCESTAANTNPWTHSITYLDQGCNFTRESKAVNCRGLNNTLLREALQEVVIQLEQDEFENGPALKFPIWGVGIDLAKAAFEFGDRLYYDSRLDKSNSSTFLEEASPGQINIRELTIFESNVPKLASDLMDSLGIGLEILTLASSHLSEIRSDAFLTHTKTLVHLDLGHNQLEVIPYAIGNLRHLEVLDLRYNIIDHLPEKTQFAKLPHLRRLLLDHNKLGQLMETQVRLGITSSGMSLTVFNLEPLRESLTYLSLSHNNLSALPDQFAQPFSKLKSLDISHNLITIINQLAFSQMSRLQYLDLSGNLLSVLHPYKLPYSMLEINLKGNPWLCDCSSLWIQENLLGNHSSLIGNPTCAAPLHLRHRQIYSLTEEDLCPSNENDLSVAKVIFVGDDVDGNLEAALTHLHFLNVTAINHQALLVSWRVDSHFYSSTERPLQQHLSWAITLREAQTSSRDIKVTKMKLSRYREERPKWVPGESLYTEVLHGLKEDTEYILCLTPSDDKYFYTRPDHCLHASTFSRIKTTTVTPKFVPVTTLSTSAVEPIESKASITSEDYTVETEGVLLVKESRSIKVNWNVTIIPLNQGNTFFTELPLIQRPLGWRITYRRFGEEDETDIVLVSRGGDPIQNFTNHYKVENLDPGTGYVFCFNALSESDVVDALAGHSGSLTHMKPEYQTPILTTNVARGKSIESNFNININNVENETISKNSNISPKIPDLSTEITTSKYIPQDSQQDFNSRNPPIPTLPPFRNPNTPPIPFRDTNPVSKPIDTHQHFNFDTPPVPELPPPRPSNIPQQFGSPRSSLFPPVSSGGFVYTSTGERIPLPSGGSPFGLPSVVGPAFHSDIDIPTPPSFDEEFRRASQRFTYDSNDNFSPSRPQQRFTYDFTPEPDHFPSINEQRFTYEENLRQRRSTAQESGASYARDLESGTIQYCQEVVTLEEKNIIAPIAVATTVSTSTTAIFAIIMCCCCPKKCKRNKSTTNLNRNSNSKKISTISSPTPTNLYSRNNSVLVNSALTKANGSVNMSKQSTGNPNSTTYLEKGPNGYLVKAGRSISMTSTNGYLTPLPGPTSLPVWSTDGSKGYNDSQAYLATQKEFIDSVKEQMLRHKDGQIDFHPGYDIPPAFGRELPGYDFPHPVPVNTIDCPRKTQGIATELPIPSPSSSDSNYNAIIGDQKPKMNLNIPLTQNKSSDMNKSIDFNNYGTPEDVTIKPRTYVKNVPGKTKHRKFGSPMRVPDNSQNFEDQGYIEIKMGNSPSSAIGDSTKEGSSPDLAATARLSLLIGSQGPQSLPSISQRSCPTTPQEAIGIEGPDYVNISNTSASQNRDMYHTWSSRDSASNKRPPLDEVILTGGTLIEVPEGYVIPKPPKPTRTVRLLVPSEQRAKQTHRSLEDLTKDNDEKHPSLYSTVNLFQPTLISKSAEADQANRTLPPKKSKSSNINKYPQQNVSPPKSNNQIISISVSNEPIIIPDLNYNKNTPDKDIPPAISNKNISPTKNNLPHSTSKIHASLQKDNSKDNNYIDENEKANLSQITHLVTPEITSDNIVASRIMAV
ncbi:unnamed protein product [Meganyctiphanes norvegica]|uniref:LRRCT domain-containing protein n=1 Tax=Meganyctiphanes norvegica TaxID=48144 RepID=A0AAV2QU46_MEGNR